MCNLIIATSIEDIDLDKWNNFVYSHPYGNIYQTPYLFKVFQETKNYEPIIIIAKRNEEIIGLLLAVLIKEGKGILGKFTAQSIIIGGPLVNKNEPETFKQIIAQYESLIVDEAIYTEIREIYSLPYADLLLSHGYKDEKRLNLIVDLTKSQEQLWSEVHSKRRNEIKKAVKKGVLVKEITEQAAIEKGFMILKEVYQRAKLPFADKSLFLNCFTYLGSKRYARYFGAYSGNELIGIMFTLCYKDRFIDWYAGSSTEHYDKNPNDIIPWEAFKIAKNEGYKIFDFGGAGKPDIIYGVRDYKKKFGGEFINLKDFKKSITPY